jgi:hypothetical protein
VYRDQRKNARIENGMLVIEARKERFECGARSASHRRT